MNSKYKHLVILIAITIATTIGVQLYWNMKIYEVNKAQVRNQVQVSFDKAIDLYYSGLAKDNMLTLMASDTLMNNDQRVLIKNSLPEHLWIDNTTDTTIHHVDFPSKGSLVIKADSLIEFGAFNDANVKEISVFQTNDSISLKQLTTKIMIAFRKDSLDLIKIDTLVQADLIQKDIDIDYGFIFTNTLIEGSLEEVSEHNTDEIPSDHFSVFSKSTFLPHHSSLEMIFTTNTSTILTRMIGSIALSFVLSIVIVGCLLFLLHIIKKQKQLSEIKNDLISNITHEFKTPISTISVALEGLQNFDAIKNPERTKNYVNMSNEQLDKLHQMVEKLLETATLKTDAFTINRKTKNLNTSILKIIEHFKLTNPKVELNFSSDLQDAFYNIDAMHFENAIANIIDNAIKYGGTKINILLNSDFEILIEDNGIGIAKKEFAKIFDQFYRIPTGNIHNVKGFGIGLYYTKKIIDLHGGTISVKESKKGKTVFKITLNHDS